MKPVIHLSKTEKKRKKREKEKGRKEVLLSRRVYREVRAIFKEYVFTAVKLRHLGTVTKVQPKHSCRLCEL